MKNITDRHAFILQQLKKNGKVGIIELSELMDVSGVTIRKDLKLLEEKNLLFRTRGGGSLNNPYAAERNINEKEFINNEEKQKIAKAAVKLIGINDSLIIGSGTTVFELARFLHPSKPITVITPALKVGLELSNRPNVEVLQLGGLIRPNSSSVAGSYADRILQEISCGILFLGVDGIDPDFGFSITNIAEATLNQKMIETAQTLVILADSTKFNRRGLGKICGFEQVDYVVTDDKVSESMVKILEEKGVKVIIA
ncbi:transcriptional regulator [Pedobacter antarcticus 4BY]|uniref:Transcriptional regulator n=2 Tax=Pedobacter antarcticus TaxID=34086 RepID=A0A081PJX4_9SPHI|nr:DeoR/GlpR family DNA-binding transcription regulator [Pedobacter antarcticus]KEQ30997.1 transcriptional regulator [Pedobacter antarcticus 4BY]SFF21251.1 transcriptional regulator, DeoR family [Pedobacter antarcticus]